MQKDARKQVLHMIATILTHAERRTKAGLARMYKLLTKKDKRTELILGIANMNVLSSQMQTCMQTCVPELHI